MAKPFGRRLISWAVALPVGAVLVLFAVSNRVPIELALWPLPFTASVPIYVVVLLAMLLGFIAGGIVSWWSAGRARRAYREQARQVQALRAETAQLARKVESAEAAARQASRAAAAARAPGIPGAPPGTPLPASNGRQLVAAKTD